MEASPRPGDGLSLTEKCGLLEFEFLAECVEARSKQINSSQVLFTITWTLCAGLACLLVFILVRKIDTVYQTRLEMPWIWVKPPELRYDGLHVVWSWLLPLIQVNDQQLVRSCGLDALVFMRVLLLAIQLLLPTAVVSCVVLMPIHFLRGHEIAAAEGNGFVVHDMMVLSAFNLPKGSSLYWFHFVLVLAITTWGCFLLKHHYKSIVCARQLNFFIGGESYNPWIQQFLATDGEGEQLVPVDSGPSKPSKVTKALEQTKDMVKRMGTFIFPAKMDDGRDQTLRQDISERTPSEGLHTGLQVPSRTRSLLRQTSVPWPEGPQQPHLERGHSAQGQDRLTRRYSTDHVHASAASVPAMADKALLATRNASITGPRREMELARSTFQPAAIPETDDDEEVPLQRQDVEQQSYVVPAMQKLIRHTATLNDALYVERVCEAAEQGEGDAASVHSVASSFELSDAVYPWWQEYKRDPNLPPLLGKPTVRFRNMVNVLTDDGVNVGVNAQHYAVLVRDLPSYTLNQVWREVRHELYQLLLDLGIPQWRVCGVMRSTKSFKQMKAAQQAAELAIDEEAGSSDAGESSSSHLFANENESLGRRSNQSLEKSSTHHKRRQSSSTNLTLRALRQRFNPYLLQGYSAEDDPERPGETWEERVKRQDQEQLKFIDKHFRKLFPDTYAQVVPVFKSQDVDYLMYQWDETIGRLDRAIEVNERTGKRLKTSVGPLDNMLIGACVSWWGPGYRFCCCFNALCGWWAGRKHDAIEYLSKRKAMLEEKIAETRQAIMDGPMTGTYFVLFSSQRDAAIATQTNMFSEGTRAFTVAKAPGPDEVNWSALWSRALWRRTLRRVLVLPFVIALVIFPVTLFTAAMGELDMAMCIPDSDVYWDWYCEQSTMFRKFITLVVPQIIVIAWEGLVMPMYLYYMTLARRCEVSFTEFEMHILHIYFLWSIFNVFLGGLLGGTVVAQLGLLLTNPGSLWGILGISLASQARFFLNYIIVRALAVIPMKMLYPHFNVIPGLCHGLGVCKSRTPRQKAMQIAVHNLRYGREYGVQMQVMFITLVFSVVCPFLLPVAVIYYTLAYVIFRYQVMYVFERSYESGGMHWPAVFHRLCVCLWAFVFLTSTVMISQEAYTCGTLLMLICTPGLLAFHNWCQLRYYPRMKNIPLDVADAMPKAFLDPAMYMPPSLRPGSVGWYPETGKVWEYWWMPLHSI